MVEITAQITNPPDIAVTVEGGITNFIGLTDVDPTTYSGQSGKVVTVNSGEDGLEFTSAGAGDVSKVGTPVDNQIGVWTGDGTIEGTSGLTYNGTDFGITGNITISGTVDGIDIATDVAANTTHKSSSGTDHSDVVTNTTHRGLTNDPHSVTATQVGLGNVSNVATDDTAYNATSWNTNSDSATKNAIRDKVETMDTAIGLNTSKVTNVTTNLSEGTNTTTTVDVNSSDGTNATLVSASATRAGLLTKAKFDEIVANNAKVTNVSTDLSAGTLTATTIDVNSSDGTNATLVEADTTNAGILGSDKWDEIVANTGASHAQSHTIVSHSDTTATGAELNTLTGGGDTTLHDHDGISENTSARHTQDTDTALGSGAVAADHGTDSTDQIVNVSYGTSATPPTASTTTEGSLYVQYTA